MNIKRLYLRETIDNEEGMVLVVALVILALMTIIGLAATNTSTLETMISGVEKQNQLNFNTAEAGIQHAKALLQSRFLEGNRVNMATGNEPDWNFALNGSDQGTASTFQEGETGGETYTDGALWVANQAVTPTVSFRVYAWNNKDAGTETVDTDGLIWVRSDALTRNADGTVDPTQPLSSIEVLLAGALAGEAITDYAAQEGGGAGKNYSALDSQAVDLSGDLDDLKQVGW